jgi:signal transduction histidine kinase/ActR/RegA family two-component response regulator
MTKFRFITAFVLYFLIFYSVIISIFLFVGKFIILPEYISSIHKSRIRFTTAIKETVENDVKRGDTFLVEKMLSRIIGIDDLTEVVLNDGRENHPFSDETIDVYWQDIFANKNSGLPISRVKFVFSRRKFDEAKNVVYMTGIGLVVSLSLIALVFLVIVNKLLLGDVKRISDLLINSEYSAISTSSRLLEIDNFVKAYNFRYNEIISLNQKMMEAKKNAAIAQMTQMMAHDVRKPFSSIHMVLAAMAKMKTLADVKALTEIAIPEINQAMESVNGLIQDVMEIGTNSELVTESLEVTELIDQTVKDTFRSHPESTVNIFYNLTHTFQLNVDKNKVMRVFSNIMGNGIQAMGSGGQFSISSRDKVSGRAMIEFTVANNGPSIPPENLPKLFEAFFTSGKRGGTGLGLAIAHKIVTAHGGTIQCHSEPEKGVSFVFTLPASTENSRALNYKFISNRADYLKLTLPPQHPANDACTDAEEFRLSQSFLGSVTLLDRRIVILIADDERIYREAFLEKIQRHSCVYEQVSVIITNTPQETLEVKFCDLAILDVDLGCQQMNGFDIVSQLRKQGNQGIICTHSNRILASDHKTAIDHGADAFLPKPMSTVHLLKLLCQAVVRARELAV